ncbi:MAG: aldo/keto reductase [Parahaliea sp.]
MDTRQLAPGLEVSALGLGCMGMSEFYGSRNDERSLQVLKQALDEGVTFFDTADMYGNGNNERLLARFLTTLSADTAQVATKCGIVRSEDPNVRGLNSSPDYIRSACEGSLQRLGVECIDLYYLHRYDGITPIEEVMETFADLRKEGKIKYVGLSEVSVDTLKKAHAALHVAALQSEYSLWSPEVEAEILPTCQQLGIGFVAYSPLGRGFLTGSMRSASDLSAGDFRASMPRFQQAALDRNLALVEAVHDIARSLNATPAQVALAWLLAAGDTIVPIPGTKNPRYLSENNIAAGLTLPSSALSKLREIVDNCEVVGERYTPTGMQTLNH